MLRIRRVFVFVALFLVLGPTEALRAEQLPLPSSEPAGSAERPAERQDKSYELPLLVILVGGGARFRNIRLEVGDGQGGTEERQFETGAYFNFGGHLLIRPAAHRPARASIRAMVAQVDGGAGIGPEVEPAGSGISLQTRSWQILGQFGYLHPIDRLQVGGLVGVGAEVLHIDLNSVLPSSKIVYVRLGPALVYDIVPRYFGLRADFAVRIPFVLGGLDAAFGDDGSGFGLDTALTLKGRLRTGFSYAFRFIWTYYRLHFRGSTKVVPAMGDGAEGADHSINFQFLFGWSL